MGQMFGNQSKSYLAEIAKVLSNTAVCIGKEQLTVSTVKSLTIPTEANYCEIAVESDVADVALRYYISGDVPTASDGMPLQNLERFEITNAQNMTLFQIIQTGAGTHTLHIQYILF